MFLYAHVYERVCVLVCKGVSVNVCGRLWGGRMSVRVFERLSACGQEERETMKH